MTRVWDEFLTAQDRAHIAKRPATRVGFGERAAVLMVDNYRAVIGDAPEPLLEAIDTWPMSTGPAGWKALAHIERLLGAVRQTGIPVVHVRGLPVEESGVPSAGEFLRPVGRKPKTAEAQERHARRYDFVEQAAPIDGEVVLRKSAPSAFFGTPLASHLNTLQVDTLIVGGESTSGCVRASVVDAASYRYRVIVVEECVYDRHEAAHALNLFDMDRKYADVLGLDEVLEWVGSPLRPRP
jgi:nicotinamidase-related amidase